MINARNCDVYFIDNGARGDAEVIAAIEEVKREIIGNNPSMVLMAEDTDNNTCTPYLTTSLSSIGTPRLKRVLEENFPYYVGAYEEDYDKVKEETKGIVDALYKSTGEIAHYGKYELYWEEVMAL